jgi:hypothetical protein
MSNKAEPISIEARKAGLMQAGARYRIGIVSAKISITAKLRARSLVHRVLEQALLSIAAQARSRQATPSTNLLSSLLPICATVSTFLWRKTIFRYAIGICAAVGVIAASKWWQTAVAPSRNGE